METSESATYETGWWTTEESPGMKSGSGSPRGRWASPPCTPNPQGYGTSARDRLDQRATCLILLGSWLPGSVCRFNRRHRSRRRRLQSCHGRATLLRFLYGASNSKRPGARRLCDIDGGKGRTTLRARQPSFRRPSPPRGQRDPRAPEEESTPALRSAAGFKGNEEMGGGVDESDRTGGRTYGARLI